MLTPRKRREMSKRRQIVINRTGPPVQKPAREQGSWEPVLSPEKLKAELGHRKELSEGRSALERRLIAFRSSRLRNLPTIPGPIPPSKPVLMLLDARHVGKCGAFIKN
jgi:hypothetical protein